MPTTWNPSDKDSHITLSNGNLTATGTAGWQSLARAILPASSGKYYWEVTCTTFTAVTGGVGVALSSASLVANGVVVTGSCALDKGGNIYLNAATTGVAFGAIPSGTVVCISLDIDNNRIWFRLGAGGNWNTSGTANPATGTGGQAALGAGATYYPCCGTAAADVLTANFGGSAFVGAVPSGYTAGFPDATASVSGVTGMAFVASAKYSSVASGPLPLMADVAGNTDALCPFSHIRVVGAGTVTFDSGQAVVGATGVDSIMAVPSAARVITISGGTPTVQLGQMM